MPWLWNIWLVVALFELKPSVFNSNRLIAYNESWYGGRSTRLMSKIVMNVNYIYIYDDCYFDTYSRSQLLGARVWSWSYTLAVLVPIKELSREPITMKKWYKVGNCFHWWKMKIIYEPQEFKCVAKILSFPLICYWMWTEPTQGDTNK